MQDKDASRACNYVVVKYSCNCVVVKYSCNCVVVKYKCLAVVMAITQYCLYSVLCMCVCEQWCEFMNFNRFT